MSSIVIPRYPRYSDFPQLVPPGNTVEDVAPICNLALDEFEDIVALCHPDVRKNLLQGTLGARRWACKQVRKLATSLRRQQELDTYYEKLEAARQAAIDNPVSGYIHPSLQLALAMQVHPGMSHEARVELRNALVAIQVLENQATQASSQASRRSGPSAAQKARRAEKAERDRKLRSDMRGGAARAKARA